MWSEEDLKNKSEADYEQFGGIYIGGGNTYKLLDDLKQFGTFEILKKIAERDIPIYGGSAGAIILTKSIITAGYLDENEIKLNDLSGLDLTHDHDIWCHYKPEMKDDLIKFKRENNLSKILTIPEDAGLFVTQNKIESVGPNKITLFKENNNERDFNSGDVIVKNIFPITNTYHGRSGEDYLFEYYESDSIEHLPKEQLSQVSLMAFHNNKLLIVDNTKKPGTYGLISGSIEKGEIPEECLVRELKEESNMRPIEYRLIGYQKCTNLSDPTKPDEYQLRYFANCEPIGPFTPDCDPDGDVTELLETDPKDYKKYFDWGETGKCIIERALKFLD